MSENLAKTASIYLSTPSYWRGVSRAAGNETWASIRDGAGTAGSQTAMLTCSCASSSNRWYSLKRVEGVFDFTQYDRMAQVTAATLKVNVNSISGAPDWDHNTYDGFLLTYQNESLRTNINSTVSNMRALRTGTAISSLPWSTVGTTGDKYLVFNSTGIAYLNTLFSKPYFKGYVTLGLMFYGDYVNVTPTWKTGAAGLITVQLYRTPTLTLTVNDSAVRMNVNDDWKNSYESPQVNIGNSWKKVNNVYVNVGNAWKTVL